MVCALILSNVHSFASEKHFFPHLFTHFLILQVTISGENDGFLKEMDISSLVVTKY